jgi:hypothetical protein
MPYSERVAEAFIDAKDNPGKQDKIVREGQFAKDPITGESATAPKWRLPTKEEADQHIADTKAMITIGSGTLALGVGGPLGTIAGVGAKAIGESASPSIERHIRNTPWIPVHENWSESDYWNEYGGK